ncbi:MAG: hypothetical protein H6738_11660 [Alphaproteobacteria bacterium]|nr:hypothetical protein [Alphaproteobacteria bacterium]MCB9697428.1 hypothetical protein [Alphaproteobacteria bacterium]
MLLLLVGTAHAWFDCGRVEGPDLRGATETVPRFLGSYEEDNVYAAYAEQLWTWYDHALPGPTAGDPVDVVLEAAVHPYQPGVVLVLATLVARQPVPPTSPRRTVALVEPLHAMDLAAPERVTDGLRALVASQRPQDQLVLLYSADLDHPIGPGASPEQLEAAILHPAIGEGAPRGRSLPAAYEALRRLDRKGERTIIDLTNIYGGSLYDHSVPLADALAAYDRDGALLAGLDVDSMGGWCDGYEGWLAAVDGRVAQAPGMLSRLLGPGFPDTLRLAASDVSVVVSFDDAWWRESGQPFRLRTNSAATGSLRVGQQVTTLYEVRPGDGEVVSVHLDGRATGRRARPFEVSASLDRDQVVPWAEASHRLKLAAALGALADGFDETSGVTITEVRRWLREGIDLDHPEEAALASQIGRLYPYRP